MKSEFYGRYVQLAEKIKSCAVNSGRNEDSVMLLPVSKTVPAEIISLCIKDGINCFGENRVQEADNKFTSMEGDFKLHLIGHLQSNKVKPALRLFDMIHSIDSYSTAEKLNTEAAKADKIQKILVQINTSGEESKSGCMPENAADICTRIAELENLRLNGLMTIGPLNSDSIGISSCFGNLRKLRDNISASLGIEMPELSMGMSDDYEIAIKEGATIVRIGSAIFGARE